MMSTPFFRIRPGAAGSKRYFWEPSPRLRKAGWRCIRLADNYDEAVRQALARNTELARWQERTGGRDEPKSSTTQGSVRAMIIAYQQSRFWRSLAPRTQGDYQHYLKRIDAWIGDQPARLITPVMIETHYEGLLKTGKAPSANAYMRVLRLLFGVGRRQGFVTVNPAEKMGMSTPARQVAPIIWSDAQADAIIETADAMGRHSVGTAVALNLWLGQRVDDVVALTRDCYHDGAIHLTQGKTGRRVELPVSVVPHLVDRIAAEIARVDAAALQRASARKASVVAIIGRSGVIDSRPLIVSEERGRRYSRDHFTHTFRKIRLAAAQRHSDVPDLADLRYMWLRHTAVTRLAEAGAELPEIAAITGHTLQSVTQIIEHYLVRTGKMARSAFRRRVEAAERARARSMARRPGTFAAGDDDRDAKV